MLLLTAPCDSDDRASCIRIPVGRPHSRKSRYDIYAVRIFGLFRIFFRMARLPYHPHAVAQPLDRRPRHEYASFQRIFHPAADARRNRRQQTVAGCDCFFSCVHQQKTSCAICIFHLSRLKAALTEQSGLLVSRRTRDGNLAAQDIGRRLSINAAGRFYLRHHVLRNSKKGKQFLIPAQFMNIKKHRAGRICIIRYMHGPFCQIPDKPAVNRSK